MKKLTLAIVFLLSFSLVAQAEDNFIVRQAKEAGVKHCLASLEKMSDWILDGGNAGGAQHVESNGSRRHDVYDFH